jgi:mannitol-1-phosphate 5-dehydrogenase
MSSNSETSTKKILIFGAGKIGRAFIGQVFGRSNYKVIFVDVNDELIDRINAKHEYTVVFKGEQEKVHRIQDVYAIHGGHIREVVQEITEVNIMAVSVGKNALPHIIPLIAQGLTLRNNIHPANPLDIILAENMINAADFVRQNLKLHLDPHFPLDGMVGLVESSIGKMVPIMPEDVLARDPLKVFAEAYNNLIVDKKGFLNPIPQVRDLVPKKNIQAWVDRKAFIHNLGHASAAYFGWFKHPEFIFVWEVLEDDGVRAFTREVMEQAAEALVKKYPDDFSRERLLDHIDDLIKRFRNKALGDTLYRVGKDLPRKLSAGDRFMGAVKLAKSVRSGHDKILMAFTYGLFFRAKSPQGTLFEADLNFYKSLKNSFNETLLNFSGIHEESDSDLYIMVKSFYQTLKSQRLL